jgi:excisionase family DNA binding protein
MDTSKPRVTPVLLRVEEVARMLGLARSTIYLLIERGELPSVRIGRAVRVHSARLESWLDEQSANIGSESVDASTSR